MAMVTVLGAVLPLIFLFGSSAAFAGDRPAASAYKYTFSRIAWTGSDTVIAATDTHGDLYYFWQPHGSSKWNKQLVAKGGSGVAYSSPSIAWTGTEVGIAVVNASGQLVYFSKKPSAAKWTETPFVSGATFQTTAIAAGDGTVLISLTDGSGGLVSTTLTSDGTETSSSIVSSNIFESSSASIFYDSLTRQYLAAITASSGGSLYFFWEFLSGNSWNQETVAATGAGSSYTGGSVAASNSNVLITAATTAGGVQFFYQPIGRSGWTSQTVSSTGGPYTSPQIAWTGASKAGSYDVITAVNSAGALDYWWVADGSGYAWNRETIAANGKQAVYANPGISVTGGSVVVTAINSKPGDVMYFHQPFDTSTWDKQIVATG